jgi:uncharacterized damage-inducible protein DinB
MMVTDLRNARVLEVRNVSEQAVLTELENYFDRIEDLRRMVSETLVDLPAEGLNWRPLSGSDQHITNSLAVLAAHIAGAEHFWIAEVVGGRPATRNRAAEFETEAASLNELLLLFENTGKETRGVFSELSEKSLEEDRQVQGKTVPVRWAILHVIDHSALHLGHMQISRQLLTGGEGIPSPFWSKRLPPVDNRE